MMIKPPATELNTNAVAKDEGIDWETPCLPSITFEQTWFPNRNSWPQIKRY